eukprot:scaffold282_cov345-Pavlova_lutheri.AAC.32
MQSWKRCMGWDRGPRPRLGQRRRWTSTTRCSNTCVRAGETGRGEGEGEEEEADVKCARAGGRSEARRSSAVGRREGVAAAGRSVGRTREGSLRVLRSPGNVAGREPSRRRRGRLPIPRTCGGRRAEAYHGGPWKVPRVACMHTALA